jgi:hypothetical protein
MVGITINVSGGCITGNNSRHYKRCQQWDNITKDSQRLQIVAAVELYIASTLGITIEFSRGSITGNTFRH